MAFVRSRWWVLAPVLLVLGIACMLCWPARAQAAVMGINITPVTGNLFPDDGDGGATWVYNDNNKTLTIKKTGVTLTGTNNGLMVILEAGLTLTLQDAHIKGGMTNRVAIFNRWQGLRAGACGQQLYRRV